MTKEAEFASSVSLMRPTSLLPLFQNRDAIMGKFPDAFTSYHLEGSDAQGRIVLSMHEDHAGITMASPKSWNTWLKSEFQKLAEPDAPAGLINKARRDFGAHHGDDVRNLRTVGCGTNVFFALSDGIFYATVERTAPKKTDSGAVNPGNYSRAAGGSTGDMTLTALRELHEEMFIVASVAGRDTAIHIAPELYQVEPEQLQAIQEEKKHRFPFILNAHGEHDIHLADHFELKTPCLEVPGLTQDVIEHTNSGDKILRHRVFGDSPHQMDVNGVDTVTVVHLPNISSRDIRGIYDGEINQKGELLKRRWSIVPIDDIHKQLERKEINMSPVPGRVVKSKDAVKQAIHQELGI
jgi:hypothetical protein